MASTNSPVVTRFAPSPTGFLHIGGARTALFNWLFARHHGGKFLLRIEDTDKARSTTEAIDAILDGMRWLGLDWDGHEYYQSQFWARHAEVAHRLLERGHAYRCYMTQEELAAQREKAQAERRPFRIHSPWRDDSCDQGDKPFVIRLKAPREGETVIEDQVQGRVAVQNVELDDFVLLRSDGTPTYMLAVVVDDHDMGVTHVIRGDDHLNNAFRQLAIINAMGWPVPAYGHVPLIHGHDGAKLSKRHGALGVDAYRDDMGVTHVIRGDDHLNNAFRQLALLRAMNWREPVYAHVPLIHGADGAKLSKRHGALGVDAYRDEMGYLPEAVNNYLLRLGWGHGDDEIISRAQATEWFDLGHVGRSPSRFDFKKLENLNGHYLREADDARLADLVAPRVEKLVGRALDGVDRDLLMRAMDALKPRAKTLDEIADGATFLFQGDPLPVDEKAAEVLKAAPEGLLAAVTARLRGLDDWTTEELDAAVRAEAEAAELGLGKLAQPLRAALTGRTVSPGIFDVLLLLGREVSLARLDAAQHYPAGA